MTGGRDGSGHVPTVTRRVVKTWIDGREVRQRLACGHERTVTRLGLTLDGRWVVPARGVCRACERAAKRRAAA